MPHFYITAGKRVGTFCENSLEGTEIVKAAEVKDLGVTFDDSLAFTPHINKIVAKVKQCIFLLFVLSKLKMSLHYF